MDTQQAMKHRKTLEPVWNGLDTLTRSTYLQASELVLCSNRGSGQAFKCPAISLKKGTAKIEEHKD